MSAILKYPEPSVIEKYLREDIGGPAEWMTEKNIISAVAKHFSRMRCIVSNPDKGPSIRMNVSLAMDSLRKSREEESKKEKSLGNLDPFDFSEDSIVDSLKKFPQNLLVEMSDSDEED